MNGASPASSPTTFEWIRVRVPACPNASAMVALTTSTVASAGTAISTVLPAARTERSERQRERERGRSRAGDEARRGVWKKPIDIDRSNDSDSGAARARTRERLRAHDDVIVAHLCRDYARIVRLMVAIHSARSTMTTA